jgi:hypothetical protein
MSQRDALIRSFYFANAQVPNPTDLLFIGDGQLLDTGGRHAQLCEHLLLQGGRTSELVVHPQLL